MHPPVADRAHPVALDFLFRSRGRSGRARRRHGLGDRLDDVAGKTYKLTHVSARRQPDLADKSKMVVVVLLTDNEVPKNVLDDRYRLELTDLARDGKIHGVSVTLGTDKQPSGTGFTYAKELGGAIVNRPDQHTFEPALFADTRVEGKLSGKGSFGDDKWDYTAAFKSSVSTLK